MRGRPGSAFHPGLRGGGRAPPRCFPNECALVISRWPSLQENCRSAGALMGFAFPVLPETSLNRPLLAVFSRSALSRTSAKGHPPTCCEASGWTTSRTRGGLLSSVYLESCQLLTTAPRLEISTRYKSL